MNQRETIEACLRHTLYTWSATGKVDPMPVERAEGIWLYGPEGQRWLDFNSQLMSVNIGHSHPKVVEAMKKAAEGLIYAFPGTATKARAKLSTRLAELTPGDLNTFFFTLGGAEANENALKLAKQYTGRQKVLSRYRSYHGATNACMQLTGDPRRLPNEPGMPGVVRVMDPWPYEYSFGQSEAEITANNLRYLEEVIHYEGPHTIAAMFIEPVTGTNGILPPPKGYLVGLKALLDKHDILLVADEVMAGWGRTGKLFACEHGPIVPDIMTMAKGLTSSYVPLGAVGVSERIAQHFRDNIFWGGLTYNSHAFAMEVALATIDVLVGEGLVENAARMGEVMRGEMDRLKVKHPCFREGRQIGLFGMIDLQNADGTRIAKYNETPPIMGKLSKFFRDNGLFTFIRWGSFMCNPPLCIEEDELKQAFEIIDRGLDMVDEHIAG